MRAKPILSLALLCASLANAQSPQISSPVIHHDPSEALNSPQAKQADELFRANNLAAALPLYEDLARQYPTVALFAERHAAAMLSHEAAIGNGNNGNDRLQYHLAAMKELDRALALGDNSIYVRATLTADSKTLVGAVRLSIPLSVGYTYHGNAAAQPAFRDAEAAFHRNDWPAAAKLYEQAAAADPTWYDAALYAGDSHFRNNEPIPAGEWFAKAIAIDPDRETAWRYWGDTLFRAGDPNAAHDKFVAAYIAEPYGLLAYNELGQWAQRTGHALGVPAIKRPEFHLANGVLAIDPTLAASTQDGRSSWIVYQQYRVAHGATSLNQFIVAGGSDIRAVVTPNGYMHTIAEEHAALRAMLADIKEKLASGALTEGSLDPSLRNIRNLERSNALGAWIALNAADAGIRQDYPDYRAHHRQHLVDYVNSILIVQRQPAAANPNPTN